MRTQLIILALMLSLAITTAQEKKQMSVRVKKIENVNGVEKITDTTYVTDDLSSLPIEGLDVRLSHLKEGGERRILMVNPGGDGRKEELAIGATLLECNFMKGDSGRKEIRRMAVNHPQLKEGERVLILDSERELNAEERKALIEAGKAIRESQKALDESGVALREANKDLKEVEAILDNEEIAFSKDAAEAGKPRKIQRIIIIREIKAAEVNQEDKKMLEKTTGITDGKLAMNEMKFYPNPSDGKFNLSFDLKEKGDTKVQVLNNEGKVVYTEQLLQFTGSYDRELNISEFPKGVYFVRIEQNEHAQVKKIVLE